MARAETAMRALAVAVAGFQVVKAAGLVANGRAFPVLGRPRGRDRSVSVSLLVPARNEEHRLRALLDTAVLQPVDEILVLDDRSEDGTAALVADYAAGHDRVRLLRGAETPDGWVGKTWACHQLASAAGGDLLLFCDADVVLAPDAVDAVVVEMRRQRAQVFSVFPRQLTRGLGERMLVPLIDEVLLSWLPYRLVGSRLIAASTANGQMLVFTRAAYDRIGGHAAARATVVEDLALARLTKRTGHRLGLALGGDQVSVRMYRGYREVVRGLGRSLRAAHGGSRAAMVADLAWHGIAFTVPWLLRGPLWRFAAVTGAAQRVLVNAKTGRGAFAEALLAPLAPIAAVPVVAAALRGTVTWKGRRYR